MPGKKAYLGLPEWAVLEPRPAPLRPVLLPKPVRVPERPPWPWIEVEYPSEDGEPMATNDLQWDAIVDVGKPLKMHFAAFGDIYVSSDLLVYYDQGNPNTAVAPDVFVAFGVPKRVRKSYRLWQERRVPDFVLEVASDSTAEDDATEKKDLYEELGVREYWMYDPQGDLHDPRLRGYVLVGREYQELPARALAGNGLAIRSEVLKLELRLEEGRLRLWDPAGQRYLLTPEEEKAARETEAARRQEEVEARQLAEARAKEEARTRRLAEARANEEARTRQLAEARANEEARARQALEARVAELEAALRESRQPGGSAD